MNAKKERPTRSPKQKTKPRARNPLAKEVARLRRELAEVKRERDQYARDLLGRIMPEFGPLDFTKKQLFEEMSRHPTPEELIRQLVAESES